MDPRHAESLAIALAAKVEPEETDVVVSPALGGLIIGYEVARALASPSCLLNEKRAGCVLDVVFPCRKKPER